MPDISPAPLIGRPRSPFDSALDEIESQLVPLPEPGEHPPIPPSLTTVEELNIVMPGAEPETAPPPVAEPAPPPVEVTPPPVVPSERPQASPTPGPPVVAVPAEQPVAPPVQGGPETPNAPFKAMREAQRREAETLAELQAARQREQQLALREEQYRLELDRLRRERETAPDADPTYIDPLEDRLAKLEQANVRLLEENQRTQQALQQQAIEARLVAEDTAYIPEGSTHDEYAQARDWYIQQQIQEAEINGEIDLTASRVQQAAAQPGNETWSREIRTKAMEQNITEAEVCRAVARQALYQQRIGMFRQAAERRGTTVPALVYEAAKVRGWTGAPRAATATTVPPLPSVSESAVTALHKEQSGAVEASLASMPTTPGAPPSLLTAAGFMSMDRNRQGQLIDYMDQAAARGMVPEDWMGQLTQGVSIPVPSKLVP